MNGTDCIRGTALGATSAESVIDALGRNVGGVIHSYGDTQSGAYSDVIQSGTLSLGGLIALALGGYLAIKLLTK